MDDPALKKLFSHPRMIELLIRRHVPEWDQEIEYSSLERLPSELIDERLRRRYPDMIWRARTIDATRDLVQLLETVGTAVSWVGGIAGSRSEGDCLPAV